MKVLYVINAPKWDDGQGPYNEKEMIRFVKEAETSEVCDEEALEFFNQYIKKPENGWDYLKLERHHSDQITTIDHTGWLIKTRTASS
jgi:hypothetical protein